MVKIKNRNNAVSEVFGTLLILLISVSLFTVVYASILSIQVDPATPSVDIIGSIEDNYLYINHLGGKPLDLDTQVILTQSNGTKTRINVTDYLTDEQKSNNKWDLGEKIKISLNDLTDFERFSNLELTVVDSISNSAVLMGNIQEDRYADINISIYTPNDNPAPGEVIDVYVNATNLGPSNASGVSIKIELPEGLEFYPTYPSGFDNETGIWTIGDMDINDKESITIKVVVDQPSYKRVKLCFLIDGSDAITTTEFSMIKSTIASQITNAVNTGKIPSKGFVELDIIQYGNVNEYEPQVLQWCRLELKKVITLLEIVNISSTINSIKKASNDFRPLAHAFYYGELWIPPDPATPQSYQSYPYEYKTIVNLIIGGNPNMCYPLMSSKYPTPPDAAWISAISQRNEMVSFIADHSRNPVQINALVFNWDDVDTDKLNYIVCSDSSTFSVAYNPCEPGWIKQIDDSSDFSDAIKSLLDFTLNGGDIIAKLESTAYRDPNPSNDIAKVTIVLKGS